SRARGRWWDCSNDVRSASGERPLSKSSAARSALTRAQSTSSSESVISTATRIPSHEACAPSSADSLPDPPDREEDEPDRQAEEDPGFDPLDEPEAAGGLIDGGRVCDDVVLRHAGLIERLRRLDARLDDRRVVRVSGRHPKSVVLGQNPGSAQIWGDSPVPGLADRSHEVLA